MVQCSSLIQAIFCVQVRQTLSEVIRDAQAILGQCLSFPQYFFSGLQPARRVSVLTSSRIYVKVSCGNDVSSSDHGVGSKAMMVVASKERPRTREDASIFNCELKSLLKVMLRYNGKRTKSANSECPNCNGRPP